MINDQPPKARRKNRIPVGEPPQYGPLSESSEKLLRAPPTHYDQRFAQLVIEDMAQGYSFGGFAGRIGVSRKTISDWREKHPEFDQACARAQAGRLRWWEEKALEVVRTGGQGSQGQMAIFGLVNAGREDWQHKQQVEISGQVTLADVVEASMKVIEARTIEGEAHLIGMTPTAPVVLEHEAEVVPLDKLF
jgi:transposase